MTLRDLRLTWRLLCKEPGYSAVAVLGLAVALAACFLPAGLVRYAWTYNAAIPGGGAIYTVKERRNLFPRPEWFGERYLAGYVERAPMGAWPQLAACALVAVVAVVALGACLRQAIAAMRMPPAQALRD